MSDIAEDLVYDIQAPIFLKGGILWPVLIVLILILLLGYWIYLKLQEKPLQEPQTIEDLWEKAIRSLIELRIPIEINRDKVKLFYIELSKIIRTYLEERFNIRAVQMTTEEFMVEAQKSNVLKDEHKDFLKELLIFSDHVKFAKFVPSVEEMNKMLELSKLFIGKTRPPQEEEKII